MFKLLLGVLSYTWIMEPDPAFEQKLPQLEKKAKPDHKQEVLSILDRYAEFQISQRLKARL